MRTFIVEDRNMDKVTEVRLDTDRSVLIISQKLNEDPVLNVEFSLEVLRDLIALYDAEVAINSYKFIIEQQKTILELMGQ